MRTPHHAIIDVSVALLLVSGIASCRSRPTSPAQTPAPLRVTATAPPSPRPPPTAAPTPSFTSSPLSLTALPPGEYILVVSREDAGFGLRVLSLAGRDHGLIATAPLFDAPALSADKWKLAFEALHPLSSPPLTEIVILDLQSLKIAPVPGTLRCGHPSWSPNADWLVIQCADGELHAVGTVSEVDITLTACHDDQGFSCYWPSWSPDGGTIAFYGGLEFSGRNSLRFLTTDCILSSATCTISDTKNASAGIPYAWSPDSQTLAVTSRGGFIDLVDPASFRVVAKPLGSDLVVTSTAWSPDGQSIALVAHALGSEDYMWITTIQANDSQQVLNYAIDPLAIIAWIMVP